MIIIFILLAVIIFLMIILFRAIKKHPDEQTTVHTQRSVQELADRIRDVARELRADIQRIEDDPMGKYGASYEIAVVLSGRNIDLIQSDWAVQVYVLDDGNERRVELLALSEAATMHYGGIKISASRAKCKIIADRLK